MMTKAVAIRQARHIALLLLCVLAWACKDESKFAIKGDIAGGKDMTLRVVMYTPSGVQTEILASQNGHFEYGGPAPEDGKPIFVELYSNDYRLLGIFNVAKGETAGLTIDPTDIKGFKADGNAFNRSMTDWLANNAINNSNIAKYIGSNGSDPVSMALLACLYDASDANAAQAHRLLLSIDLSARPAYFATGFESMIQAANDARADKVEAVSILCSADTIAFLRPASHTATLITFTSDEKARTDTVVPMLRRLTAPARDKRGLVVDHSLLPDTLTWKRTLRTDSCNWTAVWSGAGPTAPGAERFAITRLPYFVVADSAGNTLYRGTSAHLAETTYRKLLE